MNSALLLTTHGGEEYNDKGLYDVTTNNSNVKLDVAEDGSTVTIYFNGEYCWAEVTAPTTPEEPDATGDETPDVGAGYTVYYVDSAYMDQPYAYVWSGQAGMMETAASWPGVPMELTDLVSPDGSPVYSATFDKEYDSIIFHDGAGLETEDLEFTAGAYLWWSDNTWYSSLDDIPGDMDSEYETITVYFQNNWLWSDVHCYFDGSESCDRVEWPGTPMDFFENDGTYDVYSCIVPADATVIVFNGIKDDGSGMMDQTPDITEGFYDGICYYMTWDNGNAVGSEDISVIFPDYDFGGEEEEETTASFAGYSATLMGTIEFNLCFNISSDVYADPNAKVVISTPAGTTEYAVTEGSWYTDNTYMYSVSVPAKDMTSTITAQVITDLIETEATETSVQDYLVSMLKNYDEFGPEQEIVKAMLNYGAAAQLYFDYNTDKLANDTEYMTEADKTLSTADLSAFAPVIEGESDNIKYHGSSLVLKSETTLKLYFVVDDSDIPEDVNEMLFNGVGFIRNGDLWYVTFKNIDATNLGSALEFTVDGISVNFSALGYAYLAQQSSKTELVNLANALAAYYTAAVNYAN